MVDAWHPPPQPAGDGSVVGRAGGGCGRAPDVQLGPRRGSRGDPPHDCPVPCPESLRTDQVPGPRLGSVGGFGMTNRKPGRKLVSIVNMRTKLSPKLSPRWLLGLVAVALCACTQPVALRHPDGRRAEC